MNRTLAGLKTVPTRTKLVLERWRDALGPWVSTVHNAFWGLSHRVEARQGHPARIWYWASLIWAFLALCTRATWNSPQAIVGGLSPGEGRDTVGYLALLWLSVFLAAALVAARVRANSALRTMLLKGQLLPLQYAPLENERLAWHLTAPAALMGSIVALGALPALAFGIGHGEWRARDLLGLGVWLVMGLWHVPRWTPGTWQTQIEKTTVAAKGDGFWKPPGLGLSWTGWRSVPLAALLLALGAPGLFFGALFGVFSHFAPEVQQISGAMWLNWPLLLARVLVAPLPFFGFSLPPVFLLLPLWMATSDRKLLRLTSVLGADRLFWTAPRQERWQRDDRAIALLWLVTGMGYYWPNLVGDGSLALFWGYVTPAPRVMPFALAAWFYLCVFGTTTAATALWRETLAHRVPASGQAPFTAREMWRGAWVRARQALLAGFAIWLGACVLGHQMPFAVDTLGETLMALAVGGVWMLSQIATGLALAAYSPPQPRDILTFMLNPVGMAFWWFYGVFLAVNVPMWFFWKAYAWSPWMLTLSPFTLWLLPRLDGTLQAPWFWGALAVHALISLGWLLCVWRALPSPAAAPTPASATASGAPLANAVRQEQSWTAFEWKPVAVKAPAGKVRPNRLSRARLFAPTPPQRRLLDWLDRFENPLLMLEVRRLMGHNNWVGGWVIAPCYGALAFLGLFGFIARDRSTFELASTAYFVFGALCFTALITLLGYGSHANDSYDRDRLDGTLESLFLSPLSEVAIAQSKVFPHLVALWPPTLLLGPFLLVAALIATLDRVYWLIPLSFTMTGALLALTARNVTLSHLLALTSKKTGQGGTRMALLAVPLHLFEAWGLIYYLDAGRNLPLLLAGYLLLLAVEALICWGLSVERLKALRRS